MPYHALTGEGTFLFTSSSISPGGGLRRGHTQTKQPCAFYSVQQVWGPGSSQHCSGWSYVVLAMLATPNEVRETCIKTLTQGLKREQLMGYKRMEMVSAVCIGKR